MFSEKCLKDCLEWAYKKGIHFISDEIYAISVFTKYKMQSLAPIWFDKLENAGNKDKKLKSYLENYVHITGGLSKDFGISGFRVGVIYSRNGDVLSASRGLFGYMHNISSHTQYLLAKTFEYNLTSFFHL